MFRRLRRPVRRVLRSSMFDALAEKVAGEMGDYPGQAERHFVDLGEFPDREEPDYRQ